MNKKLRQMLDKINQLKNDIVTLVDEGKLDEAEAKKTEMQAAQRKFDLLYDLEDDAAAAAAADPMDGRMEPGSDPEPTAPTAKEVGFALVSAIRARLTGKNCPEKAENILKRDAMCNALREDDGAGHASANTGEDGGLTVPKDITTEIRELRRATADDLERYVNVEPVGTNEGSRVIEADADTTPWPEIKEGAKFTDQPTPKLRQIAYKIKKHGGLLTVTAELLEDTAENILAWLKKWIAKKSRATRNAKILAALDSIAPEAAIEVKTMDELKDIFNVELDPAVAGAGRLITNQTGFNYLDKLKDTRGDYVLQPDPTDKTKKLLFGQWPIVMLSNKVLKNGTASEPSGQVTTVPLYCGCTEDAVTLFDRNVISLDVSNKAGSLWENDQTGLKVRDRFDVQVVDGDAIVKAVIKIPVKG